MGNAFKDTIGCLKDEIVVVIKLLRRYHETLGANSKRKIFPNANPTPSVKSAPAAFKQSLNLVMLSDTEFHTTVDSATKSKKNNAPGRPSPFAACVNVSVFSVTDTMGKKVRAFVICYNCGKRRCIYTGKDKDYHATKVVFRQKMESVSD